MSEALSTGTVLSDRYEIKRILGQGGMGAVYLASDRRLQVKLWAIKEMIINAHDTGESLEIEKLFTDEAHILAALDHPNLPRVSDFFSEGNRKYLVMEYIEGDTLEKHVISSNDFLPVEKIIDYSLQIADVLDYLHGRKPNPIIFRDLKPANIMLTDSDRIKLIDFGIARLFVSGKDKDTIILGTPGYAPPEQYGKSQTDERSDIFSFGATLYFLMTREDPGKSPFHFPPLRKFNPKIPQELETIVLKAVSIAPESRFTSMKEIMAEIRKISLQAERLITTPLPQGPAGVQGNIEFKPAQLDFGTLKKGSVRQASFTILGDARGGLRSDKSWIKVRPTTVKGVNTVVDAIIDTGSVRHSGSLLGNIILTTKSDRLSLPVSVKLEAQQISFWSYIIALLLTVVSFVPVVGFLTFFLMLWLYYSIPAEERKAFGAFLIISLVISLLYFLLIVLLVFWYRFKGQAGI